MTTNKNSNIVDANTIITNVYNNANDNKTTPIMAMIATVLKAVISITISNNSCP